MAKAQLPEDHAINQPGRKVVLDVWWKPTGGSPGVQIAVPSGSPEFDEAALEVARDSANLAQRPPSVLSDDGNVHVRWVFERDEGRCGDLQVYEARLPTPRAMEALMKAGRAGSALDRLREDPSVEAVRVFAAHYLAQNATRVPVASAAREGACDKARAALVDGPGSGEALEAALVALPGAMEEACVVPVAALAANEREPVKLRALALAALGSYPVEQSDRAVRKQMDATEPGVLAAAIAAWARPERGRKALFTLTPFLKHPSPIVRASASAAMVRTAGDAALEHLYLLWKESASEPYEAVALELGRLSSPDSAEFLAKIGKRADVRARRAAALALARRSDAKAVAALGQMTSDSDVRVRALAASTQDESAEAQVAEILAAVPADAEWAHEVLRGARSETLAARLFPVLFARASTAQKVHLALRWTTGEMPEPRVVAKQ